MDLKEQKPGSRRNGVKFTKKHYRGGELMPGSKYLPNTFRKHQIIVFFPKPPDEKEIREVEETFEKVGFKNIKKRVCDNCDIPIQLWEADDIHTVVNADGVVSGSGPTKTKGVGENYCLNFINKVPFGARGRFKAKPAKIDQNKTAIRVAVLDTGVDTNMVDAAYLWNGSDGAEARCYPDIKTGWNFVGDDSSANRIGNDDFFDDNPGKHGSLVTQYIINQFEQSAKNRVEILPLKTHDKNGEGDLFGIICAIHFAIAKKVNIINASWGLYYYSQQPIPYLQELITKRLKDEGVLFIAAAGNQDVEEDQFAREVYMEDPGGTLTDDQLRDLQIHHFYPGNLSSIDNSVVTVTTTDGRSVSPRQNYSNRLVDLGILADDIKRMEFEIPFETTPTQSIAGSSFATAIATGIIGAQCPSGFYRPGIKKSDFLELLKSFAPGSAGKISESELLAKKHIIKGAWTKK